MERMQSENYSNIRKNDGGGISRRDFLKILGGLTVASATGIALFPKIEKLTSDRNKQEKNGKLIEDGEVWKVVIYGEVKKEIINLVKISVKTTFEELKYEGIYPEIHISQGFVLLNGNMSPALLESEEGKRSKIRIGVESAKSVLAYKQGTSLEIVLVVLTAHEAAHYAAQYVKGIRPNIPPDVEARKKLGSEDELEIEANKIAEKVLEKIFKKDFKIKEEKN